MVPLERGGYMRVICFSSHKQRHFNNPGDLRVSRSRKIMVP